MILQRTELSEFVHYLVDGEQIVRNPRIHALIDAKLSAVPPQYRKILATPVFSGYGNSEVITWSTNVFHSAPRKLSSLTGDDYEQYKNLLTTIFGEYRSAIASAPAKTKELLEVALTCYSEDTVYCADDNIVIAEWGMYPKGSSRENILLGMDIAPSSERQPFQHVSKPNEEDKVLTDESDDLQSDNDEPNETLNKETVSEKDDKTGEDDIQLGPNSKEATNDGHPADDFSGESNSFGGDTLPPINNGRSEKKRGWKWLWWLLLLLLLLLLSFVLINSCRSPMAGIPQETSPIDTTQIGLSDDSLTYEVRNRVILLIVNGGGVVDFVKAFREKYPDEKKYILENPDTP